MRILVLTPAFKRVGPVLGALILAKYLHEEHHEVVFAALDTDEHAPLSLLEEVRRTGIPFYNFEMTGWAGLKHLKRVRNYVKDNGVDAVVSYGLRPDIINSYLSEVIRLSAIREILRDQYALSYGWLLSRLGAELHMHALKKLDGIFVMNGAMATHLSENGINPSVIHLVNNFVDVAEISKNARNGERRQSDGVHMGYFGRLIRRKRVDIALRGVHKLVYQHAHGNIKFHVAGDGPLHHELLKLTKELGLSEQTIFHGYLSNPLDLMEKMDLIVLTSDSEGTPRCLLEAMSLGKTCIASDIPGMSELILDGETGYLFPQGDDDSFAALTDDIIRFRRYLSPESLHEFMMTYYDVNSCGKKMLQQMMVIFKSKNDRSS